MVFWPADEPIAWFDVVAEVGQEEEEEEEEVEEEKEKEEEKSEEVEKEEEERERAEVRMKVDAVHWELWGAVLERKVFARMLWKVMLG